MANLMKYANFWSSKYWATTKYWRQTYILCIWTRHSVRIVSWKSFVRQFQAPSVRSIKMKQIWFLSFGSFILLCSINRVEGGFLGPRKVSKWKYKTKHLNKRKNRLKKRKNPPKKKSFFLTNSRKTQIKILL